MLKAALFLILAAVKPSANETEAIARFESAYQAASASITKCTPVQERIISTLTRTPGDLNKLDFEWAQRKNFCVKSMAQAQKVVDFAKVDIQFMHRKQLSEIGDLTGRLKETKKNEDRINTILDRLNAQF